MTSADGLQAHVKGSSAPESARTYVTLSGPDGVQRWSRQLDGRTPGCVTIAGSLVVVHSRGEYTQDSWACSISAEAQAGAPCWTSEPFVNAFDVHSGDARWQVRGGGANPLLAGDEYSVAVVSELSGLLIEGSQLHLLDPASGRVRTSSILYKADVGFNVGEDAVPKHSFGLGVADGIVVVQDDRTSRVTVWDTRTAASR